MQKIYSVKKIIWWLILFFVLTFSKIINAQASVYVSPSTTVLSGQSTVTIDIMLAEVTDLHGYEVIINFDNSILSYQNSVKGTLLSSAGSGTLFLVTPSRITNFFNAAEAILGPYVVSGSGKLFSVTFDVLAAGTCDISITSVRLLGIGNQPISVTWLSGQIIVPLAVNPKFFLQGAYNSGVMNTTLNSSGNLPIAQPYSDSPWNYYGTESVSPGFFNTHTNIVDWVLVELRSGTLPGTRIDRKAGFLLNTGNVVSIDGTSSLYFTQPRGNYYIVLTHRNHISIMNSNSTPLNYVSAQYDFTNSKTKAYGSNAMIDLGGGVYGMFTGDTDANGTINAVDRSNCWNERNQNGYFRTDADLSGTVNAVDRSIIWNNRNINSQVP